MCVCSLSYPACFALAPYCHLGPIRLYHIFPHYLKRHDFLKKSYWTKNMCFDFLYYFETFLIQRRIKRAVIKKCILVKYVKYLLFLSYFNETEFPWQIFEKYSNIRFHENPFNGSRVVQWGWMDRQTDGQTWRSWQPLFAVLRKCQKGLEENDTTSRNFIMCTFAWYYRMIISFAEQNLLKCLLRYVNQRATLVHYKFGPISLAKLTNADKLKKLPINGGRVRYERPFKPSQGVSNLRIIKVIMTVY